MLWNDDKQEYCRFSEDEHRSVCVPLVLLSNMLIEDQSDSLCVYLSHQWRSPEEFNNADDINEKVDVFGLSRMMYPLLTGRWITEGERKATVRQGGKLFIDPRYKRRSLAEAKLADIIDMCQEYIADDRPSSFEVVRLLKEALAEVKHRDLQN
jgi:hypothetical protein